MRKQSYFGSRLNRLVYGVMACCIVLMLVCSCHAQKRPAGQDKGATWVDWKIEYKGEMSKDEKTKLYNGITSYVKEYLVAQKREDLAKDLRLNFTESGNTIRIIHDGSTVATGSIVKGPPPPPPPIIPTDRLKTLNPKVDIIKAMH